MKEEVINILTKRKKEAKKERNLIRITKRIYLKTNTQSKTQAA